MMGTVRQFLVYALIGSLNTLIHLAVFSLLLRLCAAPLLVASTLGYCAGVANSYYMNRLWTFAVATRANSLEFGRFLLVNLVALGVNLVALRALATAGITPELAQIGAIAASLAVNFAGNKWWTFHSTRQAAQ
jgi:putative flippase GtrA